MKSRGRTSENTPKTIKLTRISVSDKLEAFYSEQEYFRGLSFPTISSVGPNTALIHYLPNREIYAELQPDSIYLCDSQGQYMDGTTDITRTVHFGKPSAHEKACYTMVFKGHIALDTAVFPNGTTGHALDILVGVDWHQKLETQRGTVLATELKNNANKLAKWTAQALLASADVMKLGYVSRSHPRDHFNHVILSVQGYKPKEFDMQINVNTSNMWGIVKSIVDLCLKLNEGKYVTESAYIAGNFCWKGTMDESHLGDC